MALAQRLGHAIELMPDERREALTWRSTSIPDDAAILLSAFDLGTPLAADTRCLLLRIPRTDPDIMVAPFPMAADRLAEALGYLARLKDGYGRPIDPLSVLSAHAAEVSGTVRDSKGGIVSLWRDGFPKVTATTDQNGGFQFGNLAPGEYHLAAWNNDVPSDLRKFENQAVAVKLGEDSDEKIDPPLIAFDAK